VDKAVQTQLANIEKRTGKSLDELSGIIKGSGLSKHGEIRDMLKRDLGMGHGDANTLVHVVLQSDGASAAAAAGKSTDAVLDEIYTGPKTALRPIHDAFMAHLSTFGDFEIAPKKGYVSLRRKKQFAMIGPATNTRVEVGLNIKADPVAPPGAASARLEAEKPGGMCQYKVKLTDPREVDDALMAWVRQAFDLAG
jgi:predicted transport protein